MLELEIVGAVEVVVLTPNAGVVLLETAVVEALLEKENPAGAAAVVDPALTRAEDTAVAPKAGTEDDKIAPPVADVEAVVDVTVENSGAEEEVNEKDPAGFEPGVPETVKVDEAGAEEEAEDALVNAKEG